MSGAGSKTRSSAPAAAPGLFNHALFNSAAPAQAMPQYVAQPSSAGAQPDVIATRKGQPIYGPPKAFNPTMAVPAWARSQPNTGSATPFSNPLFNSQPGARAPVQSVQQPGSAGPARGGK